MRRTLIVAMLALVVGGTAGLAAGSALRRPPPLHLAPGLTTVPDVLIGSSDLPSADALLRAHGLRLGTVCHVMDEFQNPDYRQSPAAGTVVPVGSTIDLLVVGGLESGPPGCAARWGLSASG